MLDNSSAEFTFWELWLEVPHFTRSGLESGDLVMIGRGGQRGYRGSGGTLVRSWRRTLGIDVGIGLAEIGEELLATRSTSSQGQRGNLTGRLVVHLLLRTVPHSGIHALVDTLW